MKAFQNTALLVVFLSIACCMTSCQKEKIPEKYDFIVGEWEWVSSSGGYSFHYLTPETEGYEQKIVFKENGAYKVVKNKFRIEKGTYKVSEKVDETYFIKLDPNLGKMSRFFPSGGEIYVWFSGNRLHLAGASCFDCYMHTYEKVDDR